MYAIVETGGKQYRAEEGKTIRVEKLPAERGEKVVFDRVLLVSDSENTRVGKPYLEGVSVEGTISRNGRGKKITVYKYKPKKNYRRKQGHRQPYTDVLIGSIQG